MKRLPTFWGQIRIAKISGDEETFGMIYVIEHA